MANKWLILLREIVQYIAIMTVIGMFITISLQTESLQMSINSPDSAGYVHQNDNAIGSAKAPSQKQHIPKVVHLIWFYPQGTVFRFHQLMCLMSIKIHIKPKRIILWYNQEPKGSWWAFAKKAVHNIGLVHYEPPNEIFNQTVDIIEHQTDIARLDILIKYGGIYMDLDVIALRDFDPLLTHTVTMGAETPELLGSGVILSVPNATFIRLWRDSYVNYVPSKWNYNSVIKPMELAKEHPHLVNIEWYRIHRPNWFERDWLYSVNKLWDWSENYAVHLWSHGRNEDYDPVSIRTLNSTIGEIFRYIYYGNSSLLHS